MSSSGEEAEFGGSDEEDIPLANLKSKGTPNGKRRRSTVSYAENDDDDDDDEDSFEDDDVPLAALKKSAPSPKKKKAKTTASAAATKKKKKPTPAAAPSKSSSSGGDNYQSASAALYGSGCQKGLLIQRLLCRWWYAITWPDPSTIPAVPPKQYDSLDGIPGVYVCTSGEDVGKIQDFRDKEQCPNFGNFARKPASELQELLIQALEEQKRILVKAEGSGTSTESELNELLRWARKVKPSAADKEAIKVLKVAKMKLPGES